MVSGVIWSHLAGSSDLGYGQRPRPDAVGGGGSGRSAGAGDYARTARLVNRGGRDVVEATRLTQSSAPVKANPLVRATGETGYRAWSLTALTVKCCAATFRRQRAIPSTLVLIWMLPIGLICAAALGPMRTVLQRYCGWRWPCRYLCRCVAGSSWH